MKASFQIAECSFASAKILQRYCKDTAKIRDNKKIRHLFYIIPHFFLRNQNIRRIFAERFSYKKKHYGQADQ